MSTIFFSYKLLISIMSSQKPHLINISVYRTSGHADFKKPGKNNVPLLAALQRHQHFGSVFSSFEMF